MFPNKHKALSYSVQPSVAFGGCCLLPFSVVLVGLHVWLVAPLPPATHRGWDLALPQRSYSLKPDGDVIPQQLTQEVT